MKKAHGVPDGNAGLPAKIRGKYKTAPIIRLNEGRNRAERREMNKLDRRRKRDEKKEGN